MKKQDDFGMALCQSEYLGTQCDGHEDHGPEHFATVNDGAMTWTDEGKVRNWSDEEISEWSLLQIVCRYSIVVVQLLGTQ